jgi:hypothetical protein
MNQKNVSFVRTFSALEPDVGSESGSIKKLSSVRSGSHHFLKLSLNRHCNIFIFENCIVIFARSNRLSQSLFALLLASSVKFNPFLCASEWNSQAKVRKKRQKKCAKGSINCQWIQTIMHLANEIFVQKTRKKMFKSINLTRQSRLGHLLLRWPFGTVQRKRSGKQSASKLPKWMYSRNNYNYGNEKETEDWAQRQEEEQKAKVTVMFDNYPDGLFAVGSPFVRTRWMLNADNLFGKELAPGRHS